MSLNGFKFDWSIYKGGLSWLPQHTLYVTVHGSHAYGTNVETSDIDLRGIAIATKNHYLGWLSTFEENHQHEPDFVIFELKKFFKLAADANPNALELLFTDPEHHLLVTPLGQKLIDNRDKFLSQKAIHTFSGYARSQLRRIRGHREWLLHPPTHLPTRSEFGLPERTVIPQDQLAAVESAIRKKLDEYAWKELDSVEPAVRIAIQEEFYNKLVEITQWKDIDEGLWNSTVHTLGIDSNFILLLDKERQYKARKTEWDQYKHWQTTRNVARAELEAKFGYDSKHALHLCRLYLQCKYLLRDGILYVKHPDAEWLKGVRAGLLTYDQLIEWADNMDLEINELAKTTKIPHSPNRVQLDNLCVEMIEEFLG
jgi:predicted nucleotidyltransferase